MTAWDEARAEEARHQVRRRLADHIDGMRPPAPDVVPTPPAAPFRILVKPWPRGATGVPRISVGEPVPPAPMLPRSQETLKRDPAPARAASMQVAPAGEGCQSVPSTPVVYL